MPAHPPTRLVFTPLYTGTVLGIHIQNGRELGGTYGKGEVIAESPLNGCNPKRDVWFGMFRAGTHLVF